MRGKFGSEEKDQQEKRKWKGGQCGKGGGGRLRSMLWGEEGEGGQGGKREKAWEENWELSQNREGGREKGTRGEIMMIRDRNKAEENMSLYRYKADRTHQISQSSLHCDAPSPR